MTFIDVWITYAVFGALIFSGVFVWAVRAGQFCNIENARDIPLRAAAPVEDDSGRSVGRLDRYTWIFLGLVLCGVIVAVLRVAVGGG